MKKTTKALSLLLALTLSGCGPVQTITSKILGIEKKYEWKIYDEQFSAKSYAQKSDRGLEVLAVKYNDKEEYKNSPSIYNSDNPTREIDNAWEIAVKSGEFFFRMTNNDVREYSPDIAPDSSYIVFQRFDENMSNSEIFKYEFETAKETKLTDKGDARKPFISPDGRFIAYNSRSHIWVTDKEGDFEKKLMSGKIYDWTDEGLIFHSDKCALPDKIFDVDNKEIRNYEFH